MMNLLVGKIHDSYRFLVSLAMKGKEDKEQMSWSFQKSTTAHIIISVILKKKKKVLNEQLKSYSAIHLHVTWACSLNHPYVPWIFSQHISASSWGLFSDRSNVYEFRKP